MEAHSDHTARQELHDTIGEEIEDMAEAMQKMVNTLCNTVFAAF